LHILPYIQMNTNEPPTAGLDGLDVPRLFDTEQYMGCVTPQSCPGSPPPTAIITPVSYCSTPPLAEELPLSFSIEKPSVPLQPFLVKVKKERDTTKTKTKTKQQLNFEATIKKETCETKSEPHTCSARRIYLYTVLPEKGKLIWLVFYCSHIHCADRAELQLWRAGHPAYSRPVDLDLSWSLTKGGVVQHKWCFKCPDDTHKGAVFDAMLKEPTADGSFVTSVLGGLAIVSTTSQRDIKKDPIERKYNSWFHFTLMKNFVRHTPSRRHHKNGKGKGQQQRKPPRFCDDEYQKSLPWE